MNPISMKKEFGGNFSPGELIGKYEKFISHFYLEKNKYSILHTFAVFY